MRDVDTIKSWIPKVPEPPPTQIEPGTLAHSHQLKPDLGPLSPKSGLHAALNQSGHDILSGADSVAAGAWDAATTGIGTIKRGAKSMHDALDFRTWDERYAEAEKRAWAKHAAMVKSHGYEKELNFDRNVYQSPENQWKINPKKQAGHEFDKWVDQNNFNPHLTKQSEEGHWVGESVELEEKMARDFPKVKQLFSKAMTLSPEASTSNKERANSVNNVLGLIAGAHNQKADYLGFHSDILSRPQDGQGYFGQHDLPNDVYFKDPLYRPHHMIEFRKHISTFLNNLGAISTPQDMAVDDKERKLKDRAQKRQNKQQKEADNNVMDKLTGGVYDKEPSMPEKIHNYYADRGFQIGGIKRK